MLINPNGFREYDARWVYKKDIDLEGVASLGKGLGTQTLSKTGDSFEVDIFFVYPPCVVFSKSIWIN